MRNAITASKNANCIDFSDGSPTNIIPIFHTRKYTSPLCEPSDDNGKDNQVNKQATTSFTLQERMMVEHLDEGGHTEFIENILFYIGGFIVSKLLKLLTCSACRNSLVSSCPVPQMSDHDYCGVKSNSDDSASAFTHFVNRWLANSFEVGLSRPQICRASIQSLCEQRWKPNQSRRKTS